MSIKEDLEKRDAAEKIILQDLQKLMTKLTLETMNVKKINIMLIDAEQEQDTTLRAIKSLMKDRYALFHEPNEILDSKFDEDDDIINETLSALIYKKNLPD